MLARLLRLLAPLTPRRRPRLLLTLRSDRSQTGLFRSRRPHPTPSPRPRTQPLQRRSAVPSQPQPSSPTRQKNRPKLSLASLNPLWGFRLARDSSPFTPTQSPPPATNPPPQPIPPTTPRRAAPHPPTSGPAPTPPPRQNLAHPRHTPAHPSPHLPWRVPESAKKRPAAPQEFFGKNSYARKDTQFHAPRPPTI